MWGTWGWPGVRSVVDGEAVAVGILASFGIDAAPQPIADTAKELEAAGQTTMIVKRGNALLDVFSVADTLRAEAK